MTTYNSKSPPTVAQQDPILKPTNKQHSNIQTNSTSYKKKSGSKQTDSKMNTSNHQHHEGEWTTVTNRKQSPKKDKDKKKRKSNENKKTTKSPKQPGQMTISQFIGDTKNKHKGTNADSSQASVVSTTKYSSVVTPTRTTNKERKINRGSPVRKGVSYAEASLGIMKEDMEQNEDKENSTPTVVYKENGEKWFEVVGTAIESSQDEIKERKKEQTQESKSKSKKMSKHEGAKGLEDEDVKSKRDIEEEGDISTSEEEESSKDNAKSTKHTSTRKKLSDRVINSPGMKRRQHKMTTGRSDRGVEKVREEEDDERKNEEKDHVPPTSKERRRTECIRQRDETSDGDSKYKRKKRTRRSSTRNTKQKDVKATRAAERKESKQHKSKVRGEKISKRKKWEKKKEECEQEEESSTKSNKVQRERRIQFSTQDSEGKLISNTQRDFTPRATPRDVNRPNTERQTYAQRAQSNQSNRSENSNIAPSTNDGREERRQRARSSQAQTPKSSQSYINPRNVSTSTAENRYKTRVNICISINATKNPQLELMQKAEKVLKGLHFLDSTITIYAYYADDEEENPPLFRGSPFPKTPLKLKKYFANYFTKPNEEMKVWSRVYMGHDETFMDIRESSVPIFNEVEGGIFTRPLQCEVIVCIGWLLFSGRFTNLDDLQEYLNTTMNIELVLKFRNIKVHNIPRFPGLAVHLDCDANNAKEYAARVKAFFNANRINGHQFKMVADHERVAESHSARTRLKQLAMTQKAYLEVVTKLETDELIDIEMPVEIDGNDSELSVRKFLMSQKYWYKGQEFRLWKCIEKHYSDPTKTVFVVDKEMSQLGEIILDGLLPYLREYFQSKRQGRKKMDDYERNKKHFMNKIFSPECVRRHRMSTWDIEAGNVNNQEDENYLEYDHGQFAEMLGAAGMEKVNLFNLEEMEKTIPLDRVNHLKRMQDDETVTVASVMTKNREEKERRRKTSSSDQGVLERANRANRREKETRYKESGKRIQKKNSTKEATEDLDSDSSISNDDTSYEYSDESKSITIIEISSDDSSSTDTTSSDSERREKYDRKQRREAEERKRDYSEGGTDDDDKSQSSESISSNSIPHEDNSYFNYYDDKKKDRNKERDEWEEESIETYRSEDDRVNNSESMLSYGTESSNEKGKSRSQGNRKGERLPRNNRQHKVSKRDECMNDSSDWWREEEEVELSNEREYNYRGIGAETKSNSNISSRANESDEEPRSNDNKEMVSRGKKISKEKEGENSEDEVLSSTGSRYSEKSGSSDSKSRTINEEEGSQRSGNSERRSQSSEQSYNRSYDRTTMGPRERMNIEPNDEMNDRSIAKSDSIIKTTERREEDNPPTERRYNTRSSIKQQKGEGKVLAKENESSTLASENVTTGKYPSSNSGVDDVGGKEN